VQLVKPLPRLAFLPRSRRQPPQQLPALGGERLREFTRRQVATERHALAAPRARSRAAGRLSTSSSRTAYVSEATQWRSSTTISSGWTWLFRSRSRFIESNVRRRRWVDRAATTPQARLSTSGCAAPDAPGCRRREAELIPQQRRRAARRTTSRNCSWGILRLDNADSASEPRAAILTEPRPSGVRGLATWTPHRGTPEIAEELPCLRSSGHCSRSATDFFTKCETYFGYRRLRVFG